MHSACCLLASGRDERDILDHAKLICTFSQPLQALSLKALCKCMHECLTQVLTHTVARFTNSRLICPRASFKYKLCDTNSSDLSVCPSFAPFCIYTAVPNGLPVLAFADSKRSHCKWIPNDSKPLLPWFGQMHSAPIYFSTILAQKLESHWTGKVALLVLTKQSHGHVRQILHQGPFICVRFRVKMVKAHFSYHRKQVQLAWGCSHWKTARRSEANRFRCVNRFRSVIGVSTVLSWRKLRAFACRNSRDVYRDF